jgi:lysophospholipase L1-like esterase
MSTRTRKLGFALLSTIGALLLLELGARAWESTHPPLAPVPLPGPGPVDCLPDCMPGVSAMPEQPDGLPRGIPMTQHPTRGWVLPAGVEMIETGVATRVNSLSLRGPEVPAARLPHEVRILTLGDSSVFGFGVAEDQVFDRVAATILQSFWSSPVRGINGGTPGYTSVQALATLIEVGPVVQPDWVIIGTIWSDLFQTDVPLTRPPGSSYPLALYRLGTRLLAPWLPARKVGWVDASRGTGTPADDRAARTAIEVYTRTLSEIVTETRRLGARPAFLVLPAPIDLTGEELPPHIERYRQAMRAAASAAGAPLIDGADRFRQDGAGNAEFYDQIHPSKTGHARLGAALASVLSPYKPTTD